MLTNWAAKAPRHKHFGGSSNIQASFSLSFFWSFSGCVWVWQNAKARNVNLTDGGSFRRRDLNYKGTKKTIETKPPVTYFAISVL